jgi:RND family efflux transporter MFP subunit
MKRPGRRPLWLVLALVAPALAACDDGGEVEGEAPRPVRTIVVEEGEGMREVRLSGNVAAEREVDLAFRIGGRMVERRVAVGDRVAAGKIVARLDPVDEENALLSAQAALNAAEARLVEAELGFARQSHLYERGHVSRARLDNASQVLQSAQAAVQDAAARRDIARTRYEDTFLEADAPGAITAVGAEPGEVVQAGQTIARVARDDGRDAVFDVPENLKDRISRHATIEVVLANDRSVTAEGRIREVSPQADETTGTFRVRVGLADPPQAMRLGSNVTGRTSIGETGGIAVPATALTAHGGAPAVWVVGDDGTVSMRTIEIGEHRPTEVQVTAGLSPGERVVTAGVQALREGQQVRLPGAGA